MEKITKAQQKALLKIYQRGSNPPGESFLAFRRRVRICRDFIVVEWCNMWLGIEQDGYIHS